VYLDEGVRDLLHADLVGFDLYPMVAGGLRTSSPLKRVERVLKAKGWKFDRPGLLSGERVWSKVVGGQKAEVKLTARGGGTLLQAPASSGFLAQFGGRKPGIRRMLGLESVDETDRSAFSPTPGLVRAAFKGGARECDECGLKIPKYAGRYPGRCPRGECGGSIAAMEEALPHGSADESPPKGSAAAKRQRASKLRRKVADECHRRIAAGFKPQSPKLQALLDHAWPGRPLAETGDDISEVHLVPYSAFDAEDILPLLEGPIQGLYYRIEQPDEPVMLFAFNESRLACWATADPERFLGFDPRDEIVQEDWEATFESSMHGESVDEAGEGAYALHTNPSGEAFWGAAGAGVLPIAESTGRVLIGLRSAYVNEPGTWGVFGGAIDKGEDPMRAAKREVREELGYRGDMKLIPGYVFTSKGGGFRYSNFVGVVAEEFDPKLDWETETTKWVTYDELLQQPKKHFGLDALIKNSKPLIRKYAKSSNESIEEMASTGSEGRVFDAAFPKALRLIGLAFEENVAKPDEGESSGDWSGPVWDIRPVGEGWHRLLSGHSANVKVTTARHTWTSGGAILYRAIKATVEGVKSGQWSRADGEKRILSAVKRMLKTTGAADTVWLKPKSSQIQKAIISATRGRGNKERLRELMVADNFASKRLGRGYSMGMKVDWDKPDAEEQIAAGMSRKDATQGANSWQGTLNLYLDGGVGGKLGLTARIDNKGNIYTVAWRDRAKKPAAKTHAVKVESMDESDADVRSAEYRLRQNRGDLGAWETAFVVARRHGKHVAVDCSKYGRSMMFGTNGPGSSLEKRAPIDGATTLNFAVVPGGTSTRKQWFIFDADNEGALEADLRRHGVTDAWIADGPPNPSGLVEDVRADVGRPRKPGQGLTRIYGGFRFQVDKNKDRKPRKDIGRSIQNRLNARGGSGKKLRKSKEWHRSHAGMEMHRQLGRYNQDNNRTRMRETIADVRERIARWSAEYQDKGYIGETQIGTYRHMGGGNYTSPASSNQDKTLDDVFEGLLRRLIVVEALDVLQDVEFDDDTGALYLFFDPSLPDEEMNELLKTLQAEKPDIALIASPDRSIPGETVDSEWWVAYLPGKGEDGQPSAPNSQVYAAEQEPGSKIQMVVQAPPTPVEQIAMDVDIGKLLKSMGGK